MMCRREHYSCVAAAIFAIAASSHCLARKYPVQPDDVGDTIHFVASLPAHVCINELIISPTWNRGYVKFHQDSGLE